MKNYCLSLITLLLVAGTLDAQVAINDSGIAPNNSSMLDVTSTEKGVLIPRMTNAQIAAFGSTLGTSDKGMIVFNADDIKMEYWDGTAWKTMVTKTSSPGSSSDGTSFCSEGVTDYEGNNYKTVQIGSQCWMAENLKSTLYADGGAITSHWAYDNDEGNAHTYGRLYTWDAVMNGAGSSSSNPSGVQGICPDGWHVPSDAEWKELEMTIGMTISEADASNWRGTHGEGRKLKQTGEAFLWTDDPNDPGNNLSGFAALPGGDRNGSGTFESMGSHGYFWSSTEFNSSYAYRRGLYYYYAQVYRDYYYKDHGFSVRCVRD
jgi:uncharacterized protein (TIGR02145 family)